MASLLTANFGSESDEDDEDFIADEKDMDPADRAINTAKEAIKRAEKKKGGKRRRGQPPSAMQEEAPAENDEEEEEEENEEEDEQMKPLDAMRAMAKKQKIEAVWQLLNSKETGALNAPCNGSIATLCRTSKPVDEAELVADQQWKYQLGLISSKAQVQAHPQADKEEGQGGASSSSREVNEESRSMAAAAIKAAKEVASLGVAKSYNKVAVTETRKFAGKEIEVTVHVDKDSKAAKLAEMAAKKQNMSGLDKFLAELETKKKVNIIDKSKMDWDKLKASDQQMEEELEMHKKSSNRYLDKVDFLKKAELREYEIERDKRLQGDVRLRSRV
jgi:hypothetical protein